MQTDVPEQQLGPLEGREGRTQLEPEEVGVGHRQVGEVGLLAPLVRVWALPELRRHIFRAHRSFLGV